MISSLISAAMIAVAEPSYAKLNAVDASLFKNGYAMMTYEIKVPSSGEVLIKEPPQASMGTVWFFTEKGGSISELILTSVEEKLSQTVTAQSLVEILSLNKGKTVTLIIQEFGKSATKSITAKIIEATNGYVIYESEGVQTSISPSYIQAMQLANTTYTKEVNSQVNAPVIKLRSTPNKSVFMFALQNGLTWSPAYNIDISNSKELTLTAKATIINDLVDINVKEARLISGFPNIAFLGQPDPFLTYQRLQQFSGGNVGAGGGSAGLANRMDSQRAYAPATAMESFSDSMSVSDLAGFQAEDLYFYQQPNVALKKGDRGYYVIFESKSAYKHIYTLDIPAGSRGDNRFAPIPPERTNSWHQLKFKNTSGRPLTTAPAMISKNGQMLSQDTMTYVPVGAEVKIPITQSLDVASVLKEEEANIVRGSIKDKNGNPIYDLVTVSGTINLTNFKTEDIDMEIKKDVVGEMISASNNGSSTKSPRAQSDANPISTISWSINLKKGEKKELKYSYSLYVQSRGF